jgi:hypothetical protein
MCLYPLLCSMTKLLMKIIIDPINMTKKEQKKNYFLIYKLFVIRRKFICKIFESQFDSHYPFSDNLKFQLMQCYWDINSVITFNIQISTGTISQREPKLYHFEIFTVKMYDIVNVIRRLF